MRTACLVIVILATTARSAEPRFVDVSAASGLKIAAKTGVGGTNPHAVAIEDFTGDGLPDVILPTFGKPHIYFFRNLGGLKFADATRGSGLEVFAGDGTGAAVADFDRDGRLDVYLTSVRNGASRLFRGKGDGTFVDVSQKAGVLIEQAARSCAWSDIDGDGWVDLFVCCPDSQCRLFRNNKDGTFTDIAQQAGVALPKRHTLGCAFGDVDGDGFDDLFVTCYQSQVSALLRNKGNGAFEDVTEPAGLARKASSVGCVFADVFNRGRLDLFVTTDSWLAGANYTEKQLLDMKHTVESNALYVSDGAGKFTVQPDALVLKTLSHDAILEDLDHDGQLDLYVGVDAESGNQWATSKGGNRLWTRPNAKDWKEVGKEWGLQHEANCVCVPAADFDNDGDLDVLLVNFYSQPVLFRNETNGKNWLRVQAAGKKSDLNGIGARVRLFAVEGETKRLIGQRVVQSGAGYCRSSPLEVHFGLGVKPAARYQVEVLFSGKNRVVTDDVAPGQRLVVKEP